MLCSEWALVKSDRQRATIIPLRCRCWTCETCAPRRKAQLVYECKSGKPNIFITLTVRRRVHWSPDYAAVRLAHAWRTVRAEFLRENGKGSLPFICVFEKTKKGYPHLHIIGRCTWLDQKWLSKRMHELIDSHRVDVRRVYGPLQTAYYISKYVSKDPSRFTGTKRYWRSQDYLDPGRATLAAIRPHPEKWEIVKTHWQDLANTWASLAARVEIGRGQAVLEW